MNFCAAAEERAAESFEVARLFTDNMVFQQNQPIKVWGTSCDEGAEVYVSFEDSFAKATVSDGKWEAELAPRAFDKEPKTLEVYAGAEAEKRIYENIVIGDVWLVTGQSNVEYRFGNIDEYSRMSQTIDKLSDVRFLSYASEDLKRVKKSNIKNAPQYDLPASGNMWRIASHGENVNASAIGMCFALKLNELSHNEIPIGIISLGFGGKELAAFVQPEVSKNLSTYDDKSTIYNFFTAPLLKFKIKGLIWYQGEANAAYYSEYTDGFVKFINKLRCDKEQETLPVYIIELPPCFPEPDGYSGEDWQYIDYAGVRCAEGIIPYYIDNCYICSASDLWSDNTYPNNIHPNNKSLTAQRLACIVSGNEWGYEEFSALSAPVLKKIIPIGQDGKEYELVFDNTGDGLEFLQNAPTGFDAIGEHWGFVQIKTEISGKNSIRISAEEEIYILRYGYGTSAVFGCDMGLCNSAKTPAAAFSANIKTPPVSLLQKIRIAIAKIVVIVYPIRYIIFAITVLFCAALLYMAKRRNGRILSK